MGWSWSCRCDVACRSARCREVQICEVAATTTTSGTYSHRTVFSLCGLRICFGTGEAKLLEEVDLRCGSSVGMSIVCWPVYVCYYLSLSSFYLTPISCI